MTADPVAAPSAYGHRGRELALLAGSVVLATVALAAVVLAQRGSLQAAVIWYGLGFGALWGVAHVAVRVLAPAADPLVLPLCAALNGVGLVSIYRIGLASPKTYGGDSSKQLVWTALAIAVFVAVLAIVRDHQVLARYAYTFGLVGLFLLILPAFPVIGQTVNGSRLWIRLGPLQIQPSEVAKICLMIFFAGYLVRTREVLSVVSRSFLGLQFPRARDLGPLVLAWLASVAVLVFEKDLGSSLLFFGMFLVILYTATERASWLVIGLALFVVGAFASYQMFGHVQERFDVWLHAFDGNRPSNDAYQLVQGLYGFAGGGLTGAGWGRGLQAAVVPEADSDFVFAILGEEIGLVGVMAILVMYGLVVMRGVRAAIGVRDPFGKLLATGLAATMALQVFVQVGGVMRLIPLTGVTLPFISYGGSSVVGNAALIALMLRISDAGRRPAVQTAAPLYDPAAVADSPTEVVRR